MISLNRLARRVGALCGCLRCWIQTPPPHRPPRRVFILGAGFSSQLSAGYYPLTDALGKELLQTIPELQHYSDPSQTFDFEVVMTSLDMDLRRQQTDAGRQKLQRLVDKVRNFLKKRLSLSGVSVAAKSAAVALCRELFRPGDSIVTFNYDCLLENTLYKLDMWTPCGGYGAAPGLNPRVEYSSTLPANPNGITVLKLHGSLNFAHPLSIPGGGDTGLQVIVDEELFPGSHAHLGNQPLSPPVTLPTYMKPFGETRTMVHLWHEAAERVAEADVLSVVGYSMPSSDTLPRFLISSCTSGPSGGPYKPLRIAILGGDEAAAGQIGNIVRSLGRFDPSVALKCFGRNQYVALSRFV